MDRQVVLLEYLTSSEAIFGNEADPSLDQALQRFDRGLLRLEAWHSYEKRMEKIITVFPRTFQILRAEQAAIVREFVEAYPPIAISRLDNARQFYDFLRARWRHQPSEPPYLHDVAACEFACAKVRVGAKTQELEPARGEHAPQGGVRRHPDVILLHCAYDIRPIFEAGSGEAAPVKRNTPLAIAMPPDAVQPKVFEVLPLVYDVLAVIGDWIDRSELGAAPGVDALVSELAQLGLVEVRG